ncbi:neurabin-1-like [Petaurus breviceps papuanus]|uniref:neurabin-1-like n=1 Tax=Petaurus breviceps papuanus TaxID=3040969 RepID=UPI0036D89311
MMKTEPSGERSTLRSASPHRNAYRTEFQALKSAFDKPKAEGDPKAKEGEGSQQSRGRKYGSNVNRIKNLFMQMGMEPSEPAAAPPKARAKGGPPSPPRRGRPKELLEKADGCVLKLESSVSERISRFDTLHDGPSYSKFSETRRMFERNSRRSPQSERPAAEGPDDWPGAKSNRGSTDSLDSLSSRPEAVSPTVSQLSAVFENSDPLTENHEEYPETGTEAPSPLKEPDSWGSSDPRGAEAESTGQVPEEAAPRALEVGPRLASEDPAAAQQVRGPGKPEGPARAAPDELQAPPTEPEAPQLPGDRLAGAALSSGDAPGKELAPEEANAAQSSHVYMHTDYNVYRVRSRYNSDWGEPGTEPDDHDDEENQDYQPSRGYLEISGLPAEEDIPANRKIQFSRAPIKVGQTFRKGPSLGTDQGRARSGLPQASSQAVPEASSSNHTGPPFLEFGCLSLLGRTLGGLTVPRLLCGTCLEKLLPLLPPHGLAEAPGLCPPSSLQCSWIFFMAGDFVVGSEPASGSPHLPHLTAWLVPDLLDKGFSTRRSSWFLARSFPGEGLEGPVKGVGVQEVPLAAPRHHARTWLAFAPIFCVHGY